MPSAPRVSANVAFAQVCALRQAPSPGCFHAGANLLPPTILQFFGYRALCVKKIYFFQKQIKKRSMRLSFTCGPRCPGLPSKSRFPSYIGSRDALPAGVSHALALSLVLLIGGRWRSTALFNPAYVLFSYSSDWRRGILLPLQALLASLD